MTAIKIVPLRKNGKGIKGTYENVDHHAEAIRPYVDALSTMIPTMHFVRWRQGHNIHVLDTQDGRSFDLVPLRIDGKYTGVRFRMRLSRTYKAIVCDCPNIGRISQLAVVMHAVSHPIGENTDTGGGIHD